jgi:S-adenosylmethionine hydrolase
VILLFTDFGSAGPYTGQMQAVINQLAPEAAVIPLVSDAPTANPVASSYLLAALRNSFPANSIFLSIVDPGVGGLRRAVVLYADGQYFVGPDNGLFNTIAVHSTGQPSWSEITWQPEICSNSFHGRDLFAPVAAALAEGRADAMLAVFTQNSLQQWPADLAQIIYFDHFGNAMTGLRYTEAFFGKRLRVNNVSIQQAETFYTVPKGDAFWYKNANGLIEIAVNQGRAREQLSLGIGSKVEFS